MTEELRALKDHEGYLISNFGYIKYGDKVRYGCPTGKRVLITIEGKSYALARLVAETFLNYDNRVQKIFFKDNDFTNLRSDNLLVKTKRCIIENSQKKEKDILPTFRDEYDENNLSMIRTYQNEYERALKKARENGDKSFIYCGDIEVRLLT